MTAAGKITTTGITQQYATKPGVRILVEQDPTTGALGLTYRKTGPNVVAVRVTGAATVAGSRQCRYQLQTSAGTLTCAPSQTHWLARDKDRDALPAIAFDDTVRNASAPDAPAEEVTTTTAEEIEAVALATGGSSLGAVQPVPQVLIAPNHSPELTTADVAAIWEGTDASAEEPTSEPAGTFEHQISDNGGKAWRTLAVGLDADDVDTVRANNPNGEGTTWRMLPDGDDKARAIAMKSAELVAARRAFDREANWRNHGGMRTKNFGRRSDANLRRGAAAGRLVQRLESELDALRRPVREVPPLDLERLPFATHVRTDAGWYEVVKVNRKTVKVVVDPGWDDLVPIKRIREIHERKARTAPAPVAEPAEAYVSPWATV